VVSETRLAPDIEGRDHVRGPSGTRMRLLIYGDYECPYTRKALISVAQVRGELGDESDLSLRR
jgi:hypothetical protein